MKMLHELIVNYKLKFVILLRGVLGNTREPPIHTQIFGSCRLRVCTRLRSFALTLRGTKNLVFIIKYHI